MFGRIRREFAKYHRLETKDGVPLRWFEWKIRIVIINLFDFLAYFHSEFLSVCAFVCELIV